jgi:tetratricopeptide (TPR) repeat protein
VFVGGFDRTGAREVAGASLPLLSSLVDKSLVAGDGSGRFTLHPVIAAYAAHALRDQPETHEDAQRRHAEYCARWVGALAPYALRGQKHRFSALDLDMPNVRAAWLWSVASGRVDLVDAMAVPLGYAFSDNGRFLEGLKLLRPALAMAANGTQDVSGSARLHATLAGLCSVAGLSDEAYQFAKTVVDLGDNGGDLEAYVSSRSTLGSYCWRQGRFQEALAHDQQALAASRRHGDRYFPGFALGKLAVSLQALGRLDEAMSTAAEAMDMAHESDNWQLHATLLTYAAAMHGQRGEWSKACEMLREALQMAIDAQLRTLELFVRQKLGAVLMRLGHAQEARRHLEQVASRAHALAWDVLEQTCQRDLAQADLMEAKPCAAFDRLRPALRAFVAAPQAAVHLHTLMVYGRWLAASRRESDARELWRLLLADTRLDADGRGQAQASLQALASAVGDESIASVVPAAPDWDAFATRLNAEPALAPPGNGKETPPA